MDARRANVRRGILCGVLVPRPRARPRAGPVCAHRAGRIGLGGHEHPVVERVRARCGVRRLPVLVAVIRVAHTARGALQRDGPPLRGHALRFVRVVPRCARVLRVWTFQRGAPAYPYRQAGGAGSPHPLLPTPLSPLPPGESNALTHVWEDVFYACALPRLVASLRALFASPLMHAAIVQLAPWASSAAAYNLEVAALRDAQLLAGDALPNISIITAVDGGDPHGPIGSIHPRCDTSSLREGGVARSGGKALRGAGGRGRGLRGQASKRAGCYTGRGRNGPNGPNGPRVVLERTKSRYLSKFRSSDSCGLCLFGFRGDSNNRTE